MVPQKIACLRNETGLLSSYTIAQTFSKIHVPVLFFNHIDANMYDKYNI